MCILLNLLHENYVHKLPHAIFEIINQKKVTIEIEVTRSFAVTTID